LQEFENSLVFSVFTEQNWLRNIETSPVRPVDLKTKIFLLWLLLSITFFLISWDRIFTKNLCKKIWSKIWNRKMKMIKKSFNKWSWGLYLSNSSLGCTHIHKWLDRVPNSDIQTLFLSTRKLKLLTVPTLVSPSTTYD
jgi:hypothetical protein